jgi:hypothetical protein
MLANIKIAHRSSQEIAGQMTHEQDSNRLLQLAKELSRAMEEEARERIRKKLGLDATCDSAA